MKKLKLTQGQCALVNDSNKQKHLGRYLTSKEAAIAHNEAAIKLRGEFAWVNQI